MSGLFSCNLSTGVYLLTLSVRLPSPVICIRWSRDYSEMLGGACGNILVFRFVPGVVDRSEMKVPLEKVPVRTGAVPFLA